MCDDVKRSAKGFSLHERTEGVGGVGLSGGHHHLEHLAVVLGPFDLSRGRVRKGVKRRVRKEQQAKRKGRKDKAWINSLCQVKEER